jgi:glycosyltransferase involved in cell wall biosynthesis
VVASAVGGIPEILLGGGGILVPAGDPEALAAAMRSLLADPALAARLGAEGRALVSGGFGIDQMAEESLRLYRGLLAGRSPGQAGGPDHGDRPGPGSLVTAGEPVA